MEEEKGENIDFKAINYTELTPIIIKGLQELSNENNALLSKVAEIEELKKELADLK